MKKIILLLSLLFLFQGVKAKDTLQLATVLDSIKKIMEKKHIPGLLLTMVTKDSILYDSGLGMAHIKEERKVDATQLFRMGSITKTFAALALLKLEAAGHFSLSDNLKDIAPEVPFKNKWATTHPVKIIHLLEHTTGFDDMHLKAIYNKEDKELPTLDMVNLHKESLESRWKPGTRMSYCNPGYVVAGYLIEKFSGQSYHDYVKKHLFDPIGMNHSNLASFPEDKSKYVQGYKYQDKIFEEVPFYAIQGGIAGTLNSCGADMAKFLQFFLNRGMVDSNIVIPALWIKRMEKPVSTLAAKKGRKTGYGLANYDSQYDQRFPFRGHNGGIDGFSSVYNYNTELQVGFALSNSANRDMSGIEQLIIEYLTQHFTPPKPVTGDLDKALVEPFLGYYHFKSPRNQINYPFQQFGEGFKLMLERDTVFSKGLFGGKPNPLIPVEGNLFRRKDSNSATHILTENEEGTKTYIARGYFEKENAFSFWAKRIWFFASVIFAFTFSLFGLIWLLIRIFDKKKSGATGAVTSFFLSSLGGVATLIGLGMIGGNLPNAAKISPINLMIFVGTLLFGLGAFIGTFLLLKKSRSINSNFLKYYLLLVAISLVSLSIYFAQYGMLGLRLWAY